MLQDCSSTRVKFTVPALPVLSRKKKKQLAPFGRNQTSHQRSGERFGLQIDLFVGEQAWEAQLRGRCWKVEHDASGYLRHEPSFRIAFKLCLFSHVVASFTHQSQLQFAVRDCGFQHRRRTHISSLPCLSRLTLLGCCLRGPISGSSLLGSPNKIWAWV